MINDHDLSLLLLTVSAILLTTTVTFATLWLRSRERLLRTARDRRVEPSADIRHIMTAVDSMAIEIERISEGQRFTTQILADRVLSDTPQQRRVSPSGWLITPH